MAPLTEKRHNATIQTWIRSPGCVIDAFLVFLAMVEVRKRQAAGVYPYPENMYLPENTPVVVVLCVLNIIGMVSRARRRVPCGWRAACGSMV